MNCVFITKQNRKKNLIYLQDALFFFITLENKLAAIRKAFKKVE